MRHPAVAVATAAAAFLAPATPTAVALPPVGCTAVVCASAAITINPRGCGAASGGSRPCRYDCTWRAEAVSPLPGDLDYTLQCGSYGEAGGCSWITIGGCSRQDTTPQQTRLVRCGGTSTVHASIDVVVFSGGLTANADADAMLVLRANAC